MAFVKLRIPPGIIADKSPYSAMPAWIDGENFRWVNGDATRIGGYRRVRKYTNSNKSTEYTFQGSPKVLYWHNTRIEPNNVIYDIDWLILGTTTGVEVIDHDDVVLAKINQGASDWIIEPFGDNLLCQPLGIASDPTVRVLAPTTSTTYTDTPAVSVTGAMQVPRRTNTMLVNRAHGHIIMGGCSLITDQTTPVTTGSAQDPHHLRWSHPYTLDFIPKDSNRAGDLDFQERIMALTQTTGGNVLVGTSNSLFNMRFVGRSTVYSLEFEGSGCGPISHRAFASNNDVTYWMSENGFFAYNGTINEIPCPVKYHVLDELHPDSNNLIYGVSDHRNDEVFWMYRHKDRIADVVDKYVAYNYREGYWYFGGLVRPAWVPGGNGLAHPVAVNNSNWFYEHDLYEDDINIDYPEAYLQSSPLELVDEQGNMVQQIQSFIPDIESSNGYFLSFVGRQYPGSPEEIYKPDRADPDVIEEYMVAANARKHDLHLTAREISLRIRTRALNSMGPVRIGTNRLDVIPDGER